MNRWLGQDLVTLPLKQIEEEIASIRSMPLGERSVTTAERLKDLQAARRQIRGKSRSLCGL
jgi:hypothetical protein